MGLWNCLYLQGLCVRVAVLPRVYYAFRTLNLWGTTGHIASLFKHSSVRRASNLALSSANGQYALKAHTRKYISFTTNSPQPSVQHGKKNSLITRTGRKSIRKVLFWRTLHDRSGHPFQDCPALIQHLDFSRASETSTKPPAGWLGWSDSSASAFMSRSLPLHVARLYLFTDRRYVLTLNSRLSE